jgi:outer membrane protein assembly factor BamB
LNDIRMYKSRFGLILALAGYLLSASSALSAGNWGHWRGPLGNGVAPAASPPTTWSATENVKWKVAIPGAGSGSPVVWDDRVFVVTAVPTQNSQPQESDAQSSGLETANKKQRRLPELEFKVLCFDRETGAEKWNSTAIVATPHEGTHQTNGYASASPCTDGQHVYASFGSRGIYCYTNDGQLVWKRDDLGQMTVRFGFGEGSSPTLADDKLIVPWDHQGQSFVIALDKLTGATVWKQDRDEPSCWGTPLIVEHGDRQQVVLQGENFVRSYDLQTGEELWRCGGQTFRPVASPVAIDDLVIVGSGFRGAFMGAFHLDGSGDIEGTPQVEWIIDRDTPDIASPLLTSGRVYFHKGKSGILSCVDAKTGKPYFASQRIAGINTTYASPVAAGGYIFLTGRSGTVVVIRDAEELEIVATNSLGEGIDATPAAVDNQLFIRGAKHLFCIQTP